MKALLAVLRQIDAVPGAGPRYTALRGVTVHLQTGGWWLALLPSRERNGFATGRTSQISGDREMTKNLIAVALFAAFGTAFAQAPATPATPATPAAPAAAPAKAAVEAPKAEVKAEAKAEAKPAVKHGHKKVEKKAEHAEKAEAATPAEPAKK